MTSLSNICGLIDGTHIPLANLPTSKWHLHKVIFSTKYCFAMGVVQTNGFRMCAKYPKEVMMLVSLKFASCVDN